MTYGPAHGRKRQRVDFTKYLDGLYGYAMVLSNDRADAEDLVQETCLRALWAIDGLREQSNVKGWFFTILRNIWLNQVRRTRAVQIEVGFDSNASEPADEAQDPHTAYASGLERERVRAAIQQLPLAFREIILLREYEELSYQEIAAVLDCPPGTVMSRLARARSKLRNLLSGGLLAPRQNKTSSPSRIGGRLEPAIGPQGESVCPSETQ
jgi:RNA polymerase sigma-70 factor, ECF subfamily